MKTRIHVSENRPIGLLAIVAWAAAWSGAWAWLIGAPALTMTPCIAASLLLMVVVSVDEPPEAMTLLLVLALLVWPFFAWRLS